MLPSISAVRAQVDIAVRDRRAVVFARRQGPVCRVRLGTTARRTLAVDRLDTRLDRTGLAI